MIAKISKGGSFGGAVDYVLDTGKDAELLAGLGVRMKDRDSIVRSFRMQAALNPHLSKPVGHIVLAFSAQDAARLDNRRMVGIAAEYLSGMGIRNTQFIIARHRDREHPHLHILFNRVDNDGRTVSDRYRSLPFGATLQGADRPAWALLRIGQRECQGAPPARTGQNEI